MPQYNALADQPANRMAYPDTMRATPRNEYLGALADLLAQSYAPQRTQQMQGVAQFLSLPAISNTLNMMAYGDPLTTGAGMTTKVKPDVLEAGMAVAPAVKPVTMATLQASREARRAALAAGMAGERYAEKVVPEILNRGGLPAQLLQDLAQGSKSQVFVGEKSKTWNAANAAKAVEMEKAGAKPQDIWMATGTFRGPEGKLRQEISDVGTKFQPTKWDQPYPEHTDIEMSNIGSAIRHPELFKAYPELGEANILLNPNIDAVAEWNRAQPNVGIMSPFMQMNKTVNPSAEVDWLKRMQDPKSIDYWKNQAREGIKEGIPPREAIKDMRQHMAETQQNISEMNRGVIQADPSLALHELQHGIQEAEGFARGGSPNWGAQEKNKLLARMNYLNTELSDAAKALDKYPKGSPEYQKYRNLYDSAMAEKMNMNSALIQNTPDEIYYKLAGEAEARAVQKRMNMTDTQRRVIFPYESYDVPVNQLIVRTK